MMISVTMIIQMKMLMIPWYV